MRSRESGNVLFLILIAVALFAALSYAATIASRSGGGDVGNETGKINSIPIIHFAVAVRTAITRMNIGGAPAETLEFNTPPDFDDCTPGFKRCVFHPAGGGASYVPAQGDLMVSGAEGDWIFNGANEINKLGTSAGVDASTPATADIIAFLPGITQSVCLKINQEANIDLIPEEVGIDFSSASNMVNPDGANPPAITGSGATLGLPNGTNVALLDGNAYGCFEQGGTYVFFHSLVER